MCHTHISIHAPAGGATVHAGGIYTTHAYFNSRPCGRGDHPLSSVRRRDTISIHAPAGGATKSLIQHLSGEDISIHAPAGGATHDTVEPGTRKVLISIHAPAGGATQEGEPLHGYVVFQFTPLREGRLAVLTDCTKCLVFQFTPLREGRLLRVIILIDMTHFNSRPCGRGDSKRVQKKKMTIVPFAEKRGKFILL